jgi:hypothetical protein
MRRESAPPEYRAAIITGLLLFVCDCLHGASKPLRVSLPFRVEPAFEIDGRLGDMNAGKQLAAVELDRVPMSVGAGGVLERSRIAPDLIAIELDLLAIPIENRVGAEDAPEEEDRLAQRVARVIGVVFRPEERNEAVASLRPAWSSDGKIDEEGESFRLGKYSAKLLPIGASKIGAA